MIQWMLSEDICVLISIFSFHFRAIFSFLAQRQEQFEDSKGVISFQFLSIINTTHQNHDVDKEKCYLQSVNISIITRVLHVYKW